MTIAGPITPEMVTQIRATRRWMLLLAIAGWLGAFLLAGAGIMMYVASLTRSGITLLRYLGYPYLAAGIFSSIPALLFTRYVGAAGAFLQQQTETYLAAALEHERRLWKLAAVACILAIVLTLGSLMYLNVID